MYVSLLIKSLTSVFVPPVKLLSIDGFDAVVEAVNVYKAGAFN